MKNVNERVLLDKSDKWAAGSLVFRASNRKVAGSNPRADKVKSVILPLNEAVPQ
jgi:hypothetical protein